MVSLDKLLVRFYSKNTQETISYNIIWLRGIACIYILGAHLYGWWHYIFDNKFFFPVYYDHLNHFFQGYGETNPAVVFFIVLSGYCIHRNGLRMDDQAPIYRTVKFVLKRLGRIVPVFLIGILCGIGCYVYSLNPEYTSQMSATYSISFIATLYKISGLAVVIPYKYAKTYLGNIALITVSIELFCYFIYAGLFLCARYKYKIGGVVIWIMLTLGYVTSFVAVIVKLWGANTTWWYNAALFSFFPLWWVGACMVGEQPRGKKIVVFLVAFVLLTIVGFLLDNPVLILVLCEMKKLAWAYLMALLIRFLDDHVLQAKTSFLTWIGKQSYSIYAMHAPLYIFLLGANWDLISIVTCTAVISWLVYIIIEKHVSNILISQSSVLIDICSDFLRARFENRV